MKEDDDGAPARFPLPAAGDPAFPLAAARALLQGANQADTASAEEATGHPWGDRRLVPAVRVLLAEALDRGDDRIVTLATRFLRAAGEDF